MARIVTECRPVDVPFGVDFLWTRAARSRGGGHRRLVMREIATGVWESDMGLLSPDAASLLRSAAGSTSTTSRCS